MLHLAFIMDGNRRWAEQKSLPILLGHSEGAKTLIRAIKWFLDNKTEVKTLTFYAFSTENFRRSEKEVSQLLDVIKKYFDDILLNFAIDNNIKISIIGNRDLLSADLIKSIENIENKTKNNCALDVNILLAYGGDDEVLHSVNGILQKRFELNDNSLITKEELINNLYSNNTNNPDIVIRFGGCNRLSNFMPLQTIYSEIFFTETLWPDLNFDELQLIIKKFLKTKRNFGG